MEKLAIQLGKLGSILGVLAGLIELSVGARILPWIGNKESPFVLGLVTTILSIVAFFSVFLAGKKSLPTNDRKLAIFLGVLLPAVICFTTVGRLWYLPGSLLLFASFLLAFVYWIRQPAERSLIPVSRNFRIKQIFGVIGSLLVLTSVGLAFFINSFGLFQSDILVEANQIRFQVVPMDVVRLENLSTNVYKVEEHENRVVMFVYIMLILGASIALISSLADSKIIKFIGGAIVLMGLIFFLVEIPGILVQEGAPNIKFPYFFSSLGLGWYVSLAGVALIMIQELFHFRTWEGKSAKI